MELICRTAAVPDAIVRKWFEPGKLSDIPGWDETYVLLLFARPLTHSEIASAPRLRAVITPSLGYDGIELDALKEFGIRFAHGRVPENYESVAEAAVLLLLAAFYRLDETRDRLRAGIGPGGPPRATMLKGKTLGIVGYGNIAKAVVARLAGWGLRIVVANRSAVEGLPSFAEQVDLDELLVVSDAVLPLVPLTPETQGLLSRTRLLAMKPGAVLVNVSRGPVVDEQALSDPRVRSHLGTIALDVFEIEPLPGDSPLRDLRDTILTNHEIAHTRENLEALLRTAVENLKAAIQGGAMPTELML